MPPLVHVSDGGIFMSRIGCVDPMNTTPAKRDVQKPNKTRGLMKKQEKLEILVDRMCSNIGDFGR